MTDMDKLRPVHSNRELISMTYDLDIIAGIAVLLGWAVIVWWYGLPKLWFPKKTEEPGQPLDLNDAETRDRLSAFLQRHSIVGNADIREGTVLLPVDPGRFAPLAVRLGNAAHVIPKLKNPVADSLYVLGRGGELVLVDVDLTDLLDASRVITQLAGERR